MNARRAAELAARHSYGRLIAYLAVRTNDIATAEDALGEAFLKALQTWPPHGVPNNPEAWLLVSARRRLIDLARRSQIQTKALNLMNLEGFERPDGVANQDTFPDDRLKLLFICAHPAIDQKLHTPLMLQTVLGLNAAQIASAFLVAPATMGQRLVRTKAKIKAAGIPFELPPSSVLPERSQAVLQAIYAAYNVSWSSWDDIAGGDSRTPGLAAEAIWLARLCAQLMPTEPEASGLLALLLYCESRRAARCTPDNRYVPLSEQDTTLWSQAMIDEAEQILRRASTYQKLGRFQLEAAIQSIHAQRAVTQRTDWETLVQLYEGLIARSPTVGARLGHACAIAQLQTPQDGLSLLEALPVNIVKNHQPYWAIKAHLLKRIGYRAAAQQAYSQAIGLTENAAVRAFLVAQSAK